MSDYRPISCADHSVLELAAMRRQRLRIRWRDDSGRIHAQTLLPVDLVVKDGAEYLLARDSGDIEHRIRLDRIDSHNLA